MAAQGRAARKMPDNWRRGTAKGPRGAYAVRGRGYARPAPPWSRADAALGLTATSQIRGLISHELSCDCGFLS